MSIGLSTMPWIRSFHSWVVTLGTTTAVSTR